jgi:hypothetical protein
MVMSEVKIQYVLQNARRKQPRSAYFCRIEKYMRNSHKQNVKVLHLRKVKINGKQ